MSRQPNFVYGGQAVIEGVMIRGRTHYSLAVRRKDGVITHTHAPLNSLLTGVLRRILFVRGMAVLLETLLLGMKALQQSANMSMADSEGQSEEEMSGMALGVTLAVSLTLGIGIFFVLPLLIVWLIDPFISSHLLSNTIEGLLRLAIVVGYIWGIGFLGDIRRVYAYHGAEHMTVHAYEAGLPLNIANVRKFGTPHPRCGTAFLLTVVLVSVIVFAFLGRPDFEWRILSRIVLLPVIASVSYEIIRFSGVHQTWPIARALAAPGLLLQRLTTRQPDDGQIEVAITAMELAIAADAGREYPAGSPAPSETAGVQDGEPVSD
jgi:uncharacterized protein YqhQ